jgi:hypothetical protein
MKGLKIIFEDLLVYLNLLNCVYYRMSVVRPKTLYFQQLLNVFHQFYDFRCV